MNRQEEIPQRLEELIILFLQKEISEEDLRTLEDWLKQDVSFKKYFEDVSTSFQMSLAYTRFENNADDAWKALQRKLGDA